MTHSEKSKLIEETIRVLSRESEPALGMSGSGVDYYWNLRKFLADQLEDWAYLKKL